MSLFGTSWDDPKTAAIMGLAGGLLQGNAGAGLQQGLLGAQRQSQINAQTKRMEAQDAMDAEKFGIQKQQWQSQLDAAKAKQFNEQQVREMLPRVARGEIDAATAIAAGVPAELIKAIKEAPNLGRSKVARTVKGMGPDGREYEYQVDEYGQRVGDGLAQFRAPVMQDLGGQVAALDPYTLQPKAQFGKTMTFADRNAAGNLALSRERLAFDRQGGAEGMKPKLVDGQWVTPPIGMGPGQAIPAIKPTAIKDANEALALIRQAEQIIPKSTGSYAGAGMDQVVRFFGGSTGGDTAAAQLKALEGALVSKMPKMSGPQSDKDVLLYKQMAGEIGDPTIPQSRKLAALEVIKEIQTRNAGPQVELPMPKPGQMGSGSFRILSVE